MLLLTKVQLTGAKMKKAVSCLRANSSRIQILLSSHTQQACGGGLIDDVRIYDRAMPAEEVAGLAGKTLPYDKPF